jgi:hypothetical protein
VASPGTDAAEGDGSRSTALSARATGWRVPSVERTESAIPREWLAPFAAPIIPLAAPTAPAAADVADVAEPTDEHGELGPHESKPKSRRRWTLRRRRWERADEALEFPEPADLDLMALAPDDEDDHAWSELTLVSLGEGALGDTDPTGPGVDGSRDDPWSLLADERERHPQIDPARQVEAVNHGTELAMGETEAEASELENEFWA